MDIFHSYILELGGKAGCLTEKWSLYFDWDWGFGDFISTGCGKGQLNMTGLEKYRVMLHHFPTHLSMLCRIHLKRSESPATSFFQTRCRPAYLNWNTPACKQWLDPIIVFSHGLTGLGLDKTHSASLDVGTSLCLPVGVVASVVREHLFLYKAMTRHRSSEYLTTDRRRSTELVYEPNVYSFELSRPCRAIPVWFTAHILGTNACSSKETTNSATVQA